MADPINKTDLTNAKLDADSLAKFVNGAKEEVVVTRTGASYPTSANIVANIATHVLEGVTISSNVFGSTTLGIAGTVNLQYFTVVSSDPNEYIILYQNVAGVATEKKRYPSLVMMQKILDVIDDFGSDGSGTAFAFQDGMGFVMLKFLIDGAIDMINGKIERTDFSGLELSDENGFLYAYFGVQNSMINGLPFAVDQQFQGFEFQDEAGFILGKATEKGAYFGLPPASGGTTVSPVAQLNQQKRTNILGIINYGQSLSRGAYSLPPISLVQSYFNIMLKSGVLVRSFESTYDPSGFVPLVASTNGNEGETPVSGMCDGIVRRLVEEDGEDPASWVFAGMSPGRGGQSVAQLSPFPLGTQGLYEGVIEQVRDSVKLAKSLNKTYSVWAYHWAQGENDASLQTPRYTYSEQMAELFDQMTVAMMQETGQKFRPYLFTYQMNANRRYNRDKMLVAQAQWSLSKTRADVVLTTPNYIFARVDDNNHLTNEASWLLGEYASRAMKHTMVSKNGKWRPLEPESVVWTDTHIDITYHVPQGKIVIDDALVVTAINSGFDIWVTRSTPLSLITTVEAISANTVRVNLSAPAPSDAYLTYAMGRSGDVSGPVIGARGNVRDTHGEHDKATSPGGVLYPLHNASIAYEFHRNSGF